MRTVAGGAIRAAGLIAALAAASACGRGAERITVAASSGVRLAADELAREFESDGGAEVDLLLGGSGTLVDRIEGGAEVDVLLLGDERNLDRLAKREAIVAGSRALVASTRLVLVAGKPAPSITFATVTRLSPTQTLAIGNPAYSSSGLYAQALLERLGAWEEMRPRLLLRGDVAAALAAVRRGQSAAAIVYQTEAIGIDDVEVLDRADPPPSPGIWIALTTRGAERASARAFVERVRSGAGKKVFAKYGFSPPP